VNAICGFIEILSELEMLARGWISSLEMSNEKYFPLILPSILQSPKHHKHQRYRPIHLYIPSIALEYHEV
jgi:hypothetical protein